jgi:diguanylate cyclase (GGDEF)-like protein
MLKRKKRTSLKNPILVGLFLCLAGVVASGAADPFCAHVPFLAWGFFLILLSCVVSAIAGAFSGRPVFASTGAAFGLCFLATCAVHFSSRDPAYGYPSSPLFMSYCAVIILYAARGNARAWVSVAAFVVCAESWSLYAAGFFNGYQSMELRDLLFLRVRPLVGPMTGLVLSGVVPWAFAAGKTAAQQPGEPAPVPPAGPPAPPAKTRFLSAEMDTGLYANSGMDDLLSSVVYFMAKNFKAYSALGFVFDAQKNAFVLNAFHSRNFSIIPGLEIPIGKGVVGHVGGEQNSFMSGDLSLYPESLLYYGAAGETINSVLAVPILSDARELLGALVVDSTDKNSFTESHKDALRRFSVLAAALITNVRMRLYQEKAAKSFRIFYQASQQFVTALSTGRVFDVLFNMMGLLAPATRMMIVTFDQRGENGAIRKVAGPSPEIGEGTTFPVNAGLYSYAFTKRAAVNIGNYQSHPGKYYRFFPDEPPAPTLRSLIILPILDDRQNLLGLLSLESGEENQFAGETEQYLSTLIGNASVAIARAQLYERMETLAATDGLTQLYNHRTFQEILAKEMERSRRYRRPLSLLLMDIDHFKNFNDTYGHPTGDRVLREISACIRNSIRANDVAARYGGEEFAVIIPESGPGDAMILAERIRQTVERCTLVSNEERLRVTVSLGCAVFPSMAAAQQQLIDAADKALYFSKEHGRNRTTLYSPETGKSQTV